MILKQFLITIFVLLWIPSPWLYALQNLIVSCPQNKSGIVSDSSNLLNNFNQNIIEEIWSWWVNAVAEHEIMENHDTFFRSLIIKLISFILPSSPQTNHVEIGSDNILQNRFYLFAISQSRVHHIWWNIVSPFTVYFISVYIQRKLIRCLVKSNCFDTIRNFPCLNCVLSWN